MSHTPQDLFRALELAHYAERYKGRVAVLLVPAEVAMGPLLHDIQVLAAYQVRLLLLLRGMEETLRPALVSANLRGHRFHLCNELPADPGRLPDGLLAALGDVLARGEIAVAPLGGNPTCEDAGNDVAPGPQEQLALHLARELGAAKLFFAPGVTAKMRGLLRNNSVLLSEMPATLAKVGEDATARAWLEWLAQGLRDGAPDMVLLEGTQGELYGEVFTYDGSGILFSRRSDATIRPATLRDLTDIMLLLRPDVESGRILPPQEAAVARNIGNYCIYEIDGVPVGMACLKPFGDAAELAQFATLPRYRGRGRARELARFLMERARVLGYARLFALSIDPRMGEFFTGLGFQPVPREHLPDAWQRGYDMNRPSKAYQLHFGQQEG